MKANDLIAMLLTLDEDAMVTIWDADSEMYQPVSGMVYNSGVAELQSDDPN